MKKLLLSLATIFVATAATAQKALPYSNDLLSNNGDFTQSTVYAKPADQDSVPNVWNFDAKYGAKASAYVNKVYYAVTSTLASPVFTLDGVTDATLSFEHAGKFFGTPAEEAQLFVKSVDAKGVEATAQLTIPTYFTNSDWNYVPVSISLSQFNGYKSIQLLFVYKSSTTKAGTWEMKNFKLEAAGGVTPPVDDTTPTPADGQKLAAQFDFTNATPDYTLTPAFQGWSSSENGSLGNLTAIEKNGVKVDFPEGPTAHARLWQSGTNYDLRFYKTQELTVTAGGAQIASVILYASSLSNIAVTEKSSGKALVATAPAASRQRAVLPAKAVATWASEAGKEPTEVSFTATATNKLTGLEVLVLDKTTGVKAVDLQTGNAASVYDLQGRKVAAPTKGLFIVNGKKVLF